MPKVSDRQWTLAQVDNAIKFLMSRERKLSFASFVERYEEISLSTVATSLWSGLKSAYINVKLQKKEPVHWGPKIRALSGEGSSSSTPAKNSSKNSAEELPDTAQNSSGKLSTRDRLFVNDAYRNLHYKTTLFTDELEEIRDYNTPVLEAFPKEMLEYIDQYKGVTENDIVRRAWSFIETCFDSTGLEVTCGEKASSVSSDSKNDERTISGEIPLARHICGNKMDIIISNTQNEYGCGEAGFKGGTTSTKWINEYSLKVPKILKDMSWKVSKRSPESIRKVVVAGFVINGMKKMTMRLLDNHEGNVS
ncbi:hypothetical protein BDA99DRAFT_609476 [Phascolomyces articulosus]|uniref:Uncharacterized protein n=1 Tax=Phascolomyces articulosus TaxID=60185 RepID=A0AAD5P833_9FUNG|nr:hypothetical protein BDA99DRAFT_609476 [Phascolomyces articulosus]